MSSKKVRENPTSDEGVGENCSNEGGFLLREEPLRALRINMRHNLHRFGASCTLSDARRLLPNAEKSACREHSFSAGVCVSWRKSGGTDVQNRHRRQPKTTISGVARFSAAEEKAVTEAADTGGTGSESAVPNRFASPLYQAKRVPKSETRRAMNGKRRRRPL